MGSSLRNPHVSLQGFIFYKNVSVVWLWDIVFGGGDGKLQSLIPQINIVPDLRAPKVVATSCLHVLKASLEARGSKFGDYLTNKKPQSEQKNQKPTNQKQTTPTPTTNPKNQNFKTHKKNPTNQLQPNKKKKKPKQPPPKQTNQPKKTLNQNHRCLQQMHSSCLLRWKNILLL